ncbi:fructosamine kinase family protein [Pseudonocardia sp.]|uniref:fructosamine kinase family protein n=1 Tax=Pseudonocardia sp. TaxID=60912 RepID=UPI003D0C5776
MLGVAVRRADALGGGAARVVLADGRTVVVKEGPTVRAEAAGLRWLAVPGGPPLPEVLNADGDRLVAGFVLPAGPSAAAAEQLGRRLAVMHAAGAPAFGAGPPGASPDAWIGRAPMRNVAEPGGAPLPDRSDRSAWARWYAADRVEPYLRTARDAGDLTRGEAAVVERVCATLPALAGPPEPPARLHGDLWSGNVLWSADGAWLIDPAAHGGHRETDLAMLALFGCPHLDALLAGYDDAAPLAPGWRERVALHQLFPLLVHVVLFGRGYAGQAVAAARAALRLA